MCRSRAQSQVKSVPPLSALCSHIQPVALCPTLGDGSWRLLLSQSLWREPSSCIFFRVNPSLCTFADVGGIFMISGDSCSKEQSPWWKQQVSSPRVGPAPLFCRGTGLLWLLLPSNQQPNWETACKGAEAPSYLWAAIPLVPDACQVTRLCSGTAQIKEGIHSFAFFPFSLVIKIKWG